MYLPIATFKRDRQTDKYTYPIRHSTTNISHMEVLRLLFTRKDVATFVNRQGNENRLTFSLSTTNTDPRLYDSPNN